MALTNDRIVDAVVSRMHRLPPLGSGASTAVERAVSPLWVVLVAVGSVEALATQVAGKSWADLANVGANELSHQVLGSASAKEWNSVARIALRTAGNLSVRRRSVIPPKAWQLVAKSIRSDFAFLFRHLYWKSAVHPVKICPLVASLTLDIYEQGRVPVGVGEVGPQLAALDADGILKASGRVPVIHTYSVA